jgi:uncharacterized protein (UPF0332 family)
MQFYWSSSLNPIDFLGSAKQEITLGDEVNFRNSISRAYYAAYHHALSLDKLIQNHSGIEAGGVHKQFISKLYNCPSSATNFDQSEIVSIGILLKMSHRRRITADYKLKESVGKNVAETQLCETEEIIEKIGNL